MPRIQLTINGESLTHWVEDHRSLLDFLREDLGLTGSKHGCDVGDCGACTVIVNDRPQLACISLAALADGCDVQTIEGLADSDTLHPMQEAFRQHHALQCGFCTPGMVMSAIGIVNDNPEPSETEIREALEGNICRCTGYHNIVEAIGAAAKEMKA